MTNENEGVEILREAVDRVAASLPETPRLLAGESGPIAVSWPSSRPRRLAALAGVALLVLGYPAYRGLVVLPRLAAENAELRTALAAVPAAAPGTMAPAPVDLHLITLPRPPGALRSAPATEEATTIVFDRQEPVVLLVEVNPEWIDAGGPESDYLLELRGPGDRSVGSWHFGEDEKRLVDDHQGVPLLLPPGTFAAGTYELRFSRAGETLSAVSLELAWEP